MRHLDYAWVRPWYDVGHVDRHPHRPTPTSRCPTTVAAFGPSLYAVNARFGAPEPVQAPYEIVKVDGS